MALGLLIIVLVLGISASAPELGRMRQYRWVPSWLRSLASLFGEGFARSLGGMLLVIALPVAVLALIQYLLRDSLGGVLHFALSVAVLYYCFGPRDLDADIEQWSNSADPESRAQAASHLRINGRDAGAVVDGIFDSALRRWFGVLFWFITFGAAGALLFRLTHVLADNAHGTLALSERQRDLLETLADALAFIPAHLMSLGLALASDFDAVARAWREHHDTHKQGWFHLDLGFLTDTARALIEVDDLDPVESANAASSAEQSARQAQQLIWRVLIAWLAALAVLVLMGWSV
jgi:AmpE protein